MSTQTTTRANSEIPRVAFSIAEVSRMYGVSRDSVQRWIDSGELPARRLGKRSIRIMRKDLEQFTNVPVIEQW